MKRPVKVTLTGRRILGQTFDGRPIFEPAIAGSSLCYAAAGGGKTTCVSVPAVMSLLSDHSRAIFVNDVKNGEIAAQIGAMCVKHSRKFAVVDDFGVLGPNYPYRISLNAFGAAVASTLSDEARDLPFIIENITHALIDEPKDDARNFYWRESPREFLDVGTKILLDRHPRLAYPGGLHALLSDPDTFNKALVLAAEGEDAGLAAAARQLLDLREFNAEHYSQHLRAALTALKILVLGRCSMRAARPTAPMPN